ncbi:MAG: EamA family transporter [Pseudomonadales bacterium]|nr:EamA family transporter [Pseudomonadales bacterium]
MELWFAITLVAAFLQNARSLLQKRLTGDLSVNGASYVRFFYAVPFAWLYGLWLWQGNPEGFNVAFFAYVTTGAIAQIVATSCLLASFTTGNFAVGTAYSKSEAAQAALVGLILLGDSVDAWVLVGIAVSLVGVILLSGNLRLRDLVRPNRAMWLGIAAGAGFAVSAVGFRGASLALETGSYLQRAGLTVMVSVTLQMLLMGSFLAIREPAQIAKVIRAWRVAIWVGLIGMIASAGWFTAMTLKNAAVVRAVGQVELLFTIATSVWLLGERITRREMIGMALVVAGIWLLI